MTEGAARPTASAPARVAMWLFVVLSIFYIGLTKGHFECSDQVCLYQTTQGLWERHSLHTLGSFTFFDGRWVNYSPTAHGVSFLAVPLYGLGKVVDRGLAAAGAEGLRRAIAGPVIEVNPTWRWGGEVEMFFVNLFPAFTIASVGILFFLCELRLGVSPRWALVASLLLGAASYVGYHGAELYQHGAEALFLLSAVFFLLEDARSSAPRHRLLAGISAALLFLCRWQAIIAIPVLFAFLLWACARRGQEGERARKRARRIEREIRAFWIPIVLAVAVHFALNYAKFHVLTFFPESATNEPYHFHFLRGLYGLIGSPGAGVLWFCPLLWLFPWTIIPFARRSPAAAWLIGGLSLAYLAFYANFDFWHGQWCYGPRYLTAVIPLWFLPLGGWMEAHGRRIWRIVAPLAVLGSIVLLLGSAVNFSYQYYAAGYDRYKPMYGFVYSIRDSQLVTNAKAILAGNHCVDLWLVQIGRTYGLRGLLLAGIPLVGLLAFAISRLIVWSRRLAAVASSAVAEPLPPIRWRRVATVFASVLAITAALWAADTDHRAGDADSNMKKGMDALYVRHDPSEAAARFRRVLSLNPNHYGATFQLARALDETGHSGEATPLWLQMRTMAEENRDTDTLRIVDERLSRLEVVPPEVLMRAGMDALYLRHDGAAAVQAFEKVLATNPDHFGAHYQLAAALDLLGRRAQARSEWEIVLKLADRYRDAATAATARSRLAETSR